MQVAARQGKADTTPCWDYKTTSALFLSAVPQGSHMLYSFSWSAVKMLGLGGENRPSTVVPEKP